MVYVLAIVIVLALALGITWIVGIARAARSAVAVPDSTTQEKKASDEAHQLSRDRASAVLHASPDKLLTRVDQLRAKGRAARKPPE